MSRDDVFRDFYAQEYTSLAGYVWRLVADRELAHDITQEAFTRMVGRLTKVDDPRAYLYGVATNLVRRAWRKRAQHRDTLAQLMAQPVATATGLEATVAVREAVLRLAPRLRDVVLLHYWADLTISDIGRALGRPDGTVKRQLNEARTALLPAVSHD